mgnify:CR=1 FL=1
MIMKRISSGGAYEEKIGYSRAVMEGGMVYISGCVGEGADVTAQCAAALATIKQALDKYKTNEEFLNTLK